MNNSFRKNEPRHGQPTSRSGYDKTLFGDISKKIGSGKPAQESIVWSVIQWSFISAAIITLLFFVKASIEGAPFDIKTLGGIWSIFVPVITLALGYIFGKADR